MTHDSIWTVLTALGTLGAVGVALYVSVYREYRRAPKLALHFTREGLQTGASISHEESATDTMLTLAVRNARGRRTAEGVQVLLTVRWPRDAPTAIAGFRLVNQRRLQWWYGDKRLDRDDAVVSETLGPGVSRQISLALIGHPRAIHDALGWSAAWTALKEEDRAFWTEHRQGIWAVSPLDGEGSGWLGVGAPVELALTLTGRDVDATTYHSRLELATRRVGVEPNYLTILFPVWAPLTPAGGGQPEAEPCPNRSCSGRNWPWDTLCWRCGSDLAD